MTHKPGFTVLRLSQNLVKLGHFFKLYLRRYINGVHLDDKLLLDKTAQTCILGLGLSIITL